jgi:hypothetical protein
MKRVVIALLLAAAPLRAQVIAETDRGVVVAHDGVIDLHRGASGIRGVANPTRIVTSGNRVAVIDAVANEMVVIGTGGAPVLHLKTRETPVDAVFFGAWLFVVERDARSLARFDENGTRAELALPADPAFIREAGGKLLVYSRVEGLIQEIDPSTLRMTRSLRLSPFASDFETDGRSGYLVLPREAKLRTFDLASMTASGDVSVGAVPVDATLQKRSSAVAAATLAVADPSSKRIWSVEGRQSATAAFARGFVRGFLGLGLWRGRDAEFPTGVDRVVSAHGRTVAYDTTTGTLYRVTKSKSVRLADAVRPGAFAVTENGVILWQNGRLQLIR